ALRRSPADVGELAEEDSVQPRQRRPQQRALERRSKAAGRGRAARVEARRAQVIEVFAGEVLVLERPVVVLDAVVASPAQQRQGRLAEGDEGAAWTQQIERDAGER